MRKRQKAGLLCCWNICQRIGSGLNWRGAKRLIRKKALKPTRRRVSTRQSLPAKPAYFLACLVRNAKARQLRVQRVLRGFRQNIPRNCAYPIYGAYIPGYFIIISRCAVNPRDVLLFGVGFDDIDVVQATLRVVSDERVTNPNFTRKPFEHTHNVRKCAGILPWLRFAQADADILVGVRGMDIAYAPSQ